MCAKHVQGPEFSSQHLINRAWWCSPVSPSVRKRKQEVQKFKALFSYRDSWGPAWTHETLTQETRKQSLLIKACYFLPQVPDLAYAGGCHTPVLVCTTDDDLLAG